MWSVGCVLCGEVLGNKGLKMNKLDSHLQTKNSQHRGKSKRNFPFKEERQYFHGTVAYMQNCVYMFSEVGRNLTLYSACYVGYHMYLTAIPTLVYIVSVGMLIYCFYVIIFKSEFIMQLHCEVGKNFITTFSKADYWCHVLLQFFHKYIFENFNSLFVVFQHQIFHVIRVWERLFWTKVWSCDSLCLLLRL